MVINEKEIYEKSQAIIRHIYGPDAQFREGQYEAIEATMTRNRTLVVQRTGWGKSLVYFICTRLKREQNRGATMVVSPLLALMQNQIESAEKMGLKCDALNSRAGERRGEILTALENDELDLVLVTPETLFSDEVQKRLKNIKIGLFVIDEAHCVSDWGHDFRLEYGKLKDIIAMQPLSVPILATTATANDRVVEDLKRQLGEGVYVSRGPLLRDNLYIQVLHMPSKIERYAWILQNINSLKGSGIIYCLTQRDCENLAEFLNQNNISAMAYYSREGEQGEALNIEIEERFKRNEIKAIVATIKLGMGYDKGDISFIIHYQMPRNIVSYYQQIGRAGRSLPEAHTFLMCGREDEEILNHFISTAFPTEQETDQIMDLILENDGARLSRLNSALNIKTERIRKALAFLENDGFIKKMGAVYYATAKRYRYDTEHYTQITALRIAEMEQLKEYTKTDKCYGRYVVNCLDDYTATDCGKCANCVKEEAFSSEVAQEYIDIAAIYLDSLILPLKPRKKWQDSVELGSQHLKYVSEEGICLSKYGAYGYGDLVKRDKTEGIRFCDELVEKSAQVLRDFVAERNITHLCFVPSLRSGIVEDFAKRLCQALGLEFADLLIRVGDKSQRDMENSSHQCNNAISSFFVREGAQIPNEILLVDDIADSRWTLTVCGYRLMEAGADELCPENHPRVYPFVLADGSQTEE